ncbi:MAG: hypothetical protein KC656_10930 [Myxococcales bacterium]|nr:hypothetical protein [Myxococcales bacterium]
MGIWILALVGCGGPGECGAAECADICAKTAPAAPKPDAAPAPAAKPAPAAGGGGLSSFEQEFVGPILEDVRAGIRPWDAEGVGICKGERECDSFLGLTPGELAPGTHMVKAELAVPNVGEKGMWKVQFNVDCTTTKVSGNSTSTTTNNYNKEYTVFYAGKEKGYRLMPLYKIDSPSKYGARECTYKITAPHPDGPGQTWEGSWKVPAEG